MSYSGFPGCDYNYKKTFWENSHDRCVTFSCLYYWVRPHLVKDFIEENVNIRASYFFDKRPNDQAPIITGDRQIYTDKAKRNLDEFPYRFDPSMVCPHCKTRKCEFSKPNDW